MLALPEQILASTNGLNGRDLYRSWLGCTQQQTLPSALRFLRRPINSVNWIVADHYGLDICWEVQLLEGLSEDAAPSFW